MCMNLMFGDPLGGLVLKAGLTKNQMPKDQNVLFFLTGESNESFAIVKRIRSSDVFMAKTIREIANLFTENVSFQTPQS